MRMDEWGVDLLLTASQKGLMTPPGLGYLIIGERAEIHAKKYQRGLPTGIGVLDLIQQTFMRFILEPLQHTYFLHKRRHWKLSMRKVKIMSLKGMKY